MQGGIIPPPALMQPKTVSSPHKCRERQQLIARKEKTMTRKLQRRLDAYKHELNSRIGFDNRRRWTQRVLADIEKSALTGKEKVMLKNAIIKAYEQI